MSKVLKNDKGHLLVTLPVAGTRVSLRPPKGRDLKAIEVASQQPGMTNTGMMMELVALLSVEPALTVDDVEDMDAEDVAALGVALGNFRALRKTDA